jgi:C-methyltransferase
VSARGGDLLAAVPAGGDLYILKRVLVDRTDDEARTLFTNIRRAMAPQGRVRVADPDSRSPFGKWYDMLMLMVFGSRLRTEADVQALLAQTGGAGRAPGAPAQPNAAAAKKRREQSPLAVKQLGRSN